MKKLVKCYLIVDNRGIIKYKNVLFETDEVARASKDFCPDEGDTIIESFGFRKKKAFKVGLLARLSALLAKAITAVKKFFC